MGHSHNVELGFYRIAQETLNNIVKHSCATKANLVLKSLPGKIIMTIDDDGVGFNPKDTSSENLGLIIMKERAKMIGASLDLESYPGKGTKILVIIIIKKIKIIIMTKKNKIKVMVVDDHPLVRHGIKTVFEAYDDILLVAEAENGKEAIDIYEKHMPDIVLMDMMMPILDGAEATSPSIKRWPDAKIIALTSFNDNDLIKNSLKAGAVSYL